MSALATPRLVRLRRGTRVRARGDGLLQVGTDPQLRALVPDTASVRGLLHLLEHGVRLDASAALAPVATALERAALLVDPDETQLLHDARACTRVDVSAPDELTDQVGQLLQLAGLGHSPTSAGPNADAGADGDTGVLLHVAVGTEPAPLPAEGAASERPTLHVALVDSRVRVGPFVVPGRTACTGCVQAHEAEADPWAHGLVDLHPVASGRSAAGGATCLDDLDPLLVHVALAAAVQDVVAWAEGRQPLAWSSTRWFEADQRITCRTWSRHPHCGCAWDEDAADR